MNFNPGKLTNNDLGTKVADPVGSKFELAGVRSFEAGRGGRRQCIDINVFFLKDITHRDAELGVRYNCTFKQTVAMKKMELKF